MSFTTKNPNSKEHMTTSELADQIEKKWRGRMKVVHFAVIPLLVLGLLLHVAQREMSVTHQTAIIWLPTNNITTIVTEAELQTFYRGTEGADFKGNLFSLGAYQSAFSNNEHKVLISPEGILYSTHIGKTRFMYLGRYSYKTSHFFMKSDAVSYVKPNTIEIKITKNLGNIIFMSISATFITFVTNWLIYVVFTIPSIWDIAKSHIEKKEKAAKLRVVEEISLRE